MERCIELFSIFGSYDVFLDIDKTYEELIQEHLFANIGEIYNYLDNTLLDEKKYARLIHALAIGDRKMISAFKKARLSEKEGGEYLNFLESAGVIVIEYSRETDPRLLHTHPLKRELARHRIVHKVRFVDPFIRFYYAFISPHLHEITQGEYAKFYQRFEKRFYGYIGFTFENLSLMYINTMTPKIVENGSYWDKDVEIDILALNNDDKVFVGECKWTNSKINKKEIHKLQEKCETIHLEFDVMIFFSKRGYSNEIQKLQDEKLLLISASDFEKLVAN